jgi:SPOR domain
MADNNFRSYRSRDPLAPGSTNAPASTRPLDDPLAELARLIGQSDPMNDDRQPAAPARDFVAPADGVDRAADDRYAERNEPSQDGYDQRYDERYETPRLGDPYPPPGPALLPDSAYKPSGQFPAPAPRLNNARDDSHGYALVEQPRHRDAQEPDDRQSPAFLPRSRDSRYQYGDQPRDAADEYALEDYEEDAPSGRRHGGLVVIAAVLGLAVLGTAGAFAYRAMFGGSMLPTLPPIIKAEGGPNRIMPNGATSQGNTSDQANASSAGSGEKLVPRQEAPVDMPQQANPAPNTAPRVVATIPIFPDQTPGPPSGQLPPASGQPVPNAPAPGAAVPPMLAVQNAPAVAPTSGAGQLNAAQGAGSTAPKKIHTLAIRPDEMGGSDASAAPAPPPAQAAPSKPVVQHVPKPTAAPQADANAPLSIMPTQGDERAPAPVRARPAAAAPTTLASAEPAPAAGAGVGYAVQVSSQRSEAEAHTAFRALQAKFPGQLGGQQPIVRRADLGDKGVYYRALVGPFASMEQAAGVCSSLKAAGGNCIVQKN